jgi:prepilin-type N-terminal cleavage/methylation domain-containing protein
MKRLDTHGFTFVELLTAMALFAILVVIAWGKFNNSYERALRVTLVSDLRNTATAQELYYRVHQTYAADMALLQASVKPSPKSTVYIADSNPMGWTGWNEIAQTDERCELWVGKNVTPALGIATTSERIYCD